MSSVVAPGSTPLRTDGPSAPGALRIGISGSYGGFNLGDEAILTTILEHLRNAQLPGGPPEVTVFSRAADDTRLRHDVHEVISVREIGRAEARSVVSRLDALLLGGGGILYDAEAHVYLREVELAHELGVPVMVYAVGVGPLLDRAARTLVAEQLERAAVITVRDRHARQLLEEIGVKREVQWTADPAVLLEPEPLPPGTLEREGLDQAPRLVGFSVREPGPAAPDVDVDYYHALLANAADFVIDRLDADILFVPMERQHMDMQHSHAVIARMRMPQRANVLKGDYTPGQVMTLLERLDLAVGMRLHFLLFAAHQGVPVVALPCAPKLAGLFEDLKLAAPPPMFHLSTGRLIAHIDRWWDMRAELRTRIRNAFPLLQARARENERLLDALLKQLAGRSHIKRRLRRPAGRAHP